MPTDNESIPHTWELKVETPLKDHTMKYDINIPVEHMKLIFNTVYNEYFKCDNKTTDKGSCTQRTFWGYGKNTDVDVLQSLMLKFTKNNQSEWYFDFTNSTDATNLATHVRKMYDNANSFSSNKKHYLGSLYKSLECVCDLKKKYFCSIFLG